MRLEDIDWGAGTIRVAGTKTRRVDILPLPATTGAAIAAYLRDERPQTSDRALFVRHVAPFDTPVSKDVVRRAVLAATGDADGPGHGSIFSGTASRADSPGRHADEGDRRYSASSEPRHFSDLHKG